MEEEELKYQIHHAWWLSFHLCGVSLGSLHSGMVVGSEKIATTKIDIFHNY